VPAFANPGRALPELADLAIAELAQAIDEPLNEHIGVDEPALTAIDFDEIEIEL
jgi:hypothetical protein